MILHRSVAAPGKAKSTSTIPESWIPWPFRGKREFSWPSRAFERSEGPELLLIIQTQQAPHLKTKANGNVNVRYGPRREVCARQLIEVVRFPRREGLGKRDIPCCNVVLLNLA
jgi:hypothetical protein